MQKLLVKELTVLQMNNIIFEGTLVLQVEGSDRYLRISMRLAASSLASVMLGVKFGRPTTHDLFVSFVKECEGVSFDRVVINDLRDDIYYAKIILRVGQEVKEIDARPSDAIAIAILSNIDIFAQESLLDKATITKEALENIRGKSGGDKIPPITEEELKRLEPFQEFIQKLEGIDDLGSDDSDDPQPA